MNLNRHPNPVIRQLYAEVMALHAERKRLLRAKYFFKFDATQPRVPAGSPDGGQWVGNNSGGGQNGTGGDPQLERVRGPATPARPPFMRPGPLPGQQPGPASPYLRPPQSPQPDTPSRPPYLQPSLPQDPRFPRTVGDLQQRLLEYNELSRQNGSNSQAVFSFRATEFTFADPRQPIAETRALTRDEVTSVCKQLPTVEALVAEARAAIAKENQNLSPRELGTAIHHYVANRINNANIDGFKAEVSLIKTTQAGSITPDDIVYGRPGSIRIDAYERLRDGTVCVYDIKTGTSGLSYPRMWEITDTARRLFKNTFRILTTEVRG
ncbi:MAG: hypothetical protein WCH83_08120 [Alphaproteobacteria bacterium]